MGEEGWNRQAEGRADQTFFLHSKLNFAMQKQEVNNRAVTLLFPQIEQAIFKPHPKKIYKLKREWKYFQEWAKERFGFHFKFH